MNRFRQFWTVLDDERRVDGYRRITVNVLPVVVGVVLVRAPTRSGDVMGGDLELDGIEPGGPHAPTPHPPSRAGDEEGRDMVIERPIPTWEAPEGCHHVAVPDPAWRIVWGGRSDLPGRRCRWIEGRKACGAPAVAALQRRPGKWWAYCPEHLYGRWIEDDVVMHWIVRQDDVE